MMKQIKFKLFLIVVFSIMFAGCTQNPDFIATSSYKLKSAQDNENIISKTFLYTEWVSVSSLWAMSHDDMRNTLIVQMNSKSSQTISSLQAKDDEELAWGALMYNFLLNSGLKTSSQLESMSFDDFRNTIIVANNQNTSNSITTLQGYSNAKNLNVAYSWWLPDNSTTQNMIDSLNGITSSSYSFDLKDDQNTTMEVLRTVKADETYTYLGVYHAMISSNHYKLYLAGSNDLVNWTYLAELGDRAHQGYIVKWNNGYLVANEQDPTEGYNNVQIRYYSSYANLVSNNSSYNKSISRSFSSYAEGTPDIRSISGTSPSSSYIVIGFHYYDTDNTGVDQQAIGVLKDFTSWRAWTDDISNYNIQEMGFDGNVGARAGFAFNGNYVLQEAQQTQNDWSSWRLLFGDGAFYYQLSPVTPKGSVSFANPGISSIGSNVFAVTTYLPTEGNQVGEIGELIYQVQF